MSRDLASALTPTPAGAFASAGIGDYWALLKPRVMSLVIFSAFAGLYLAPGSIHPVIAAVAILAIAVGAGASGAMNMWYDRDIDGLMARTCDRPLPKGIVDPESALGFGAVLALFAIMLMGLAVNVAAASLLAFTVFFYVVVYTIWLKRRTPQNIVIGGAAGAFPPMIGWAAVTGGIDLGAIVLFLLIFLWTPPHFWALALWRAGDYAKAGVPMLPVAAGSLATRRQMLLYTILLLPVALLPTLIGLAGWVYGGFSVLLNLIFIAFAFRLLRREDMRLAKRMFGFSLLYLFLHFSLLMLDRAPGILALLSGLWG